jgi:aryl-alcohol dehydrogenase-like predicted oxidoreductase
MTVATVTTDINIGPFKIPSNGQNMIMNNYAQRNVPVFGQLDFEYDSTDTNWTPIEEVLENLNDLVRNGKIKHIGLSNETPWGVTKYLITAKKKKLPRAMSVQNGYSLVNRIFDIANSEVSIREKCGLLAHSPLAGGMLSGKYLYGKKPKNSRFTLWSKRFLRYNIKRKEIAIAKYVKVAKKCNISLSTLAYAFVASRPYVTSCIIGSTSLKQLKENINSINVNLSNEIINEIEEIHLSDPNPGY